MADTMTDIGIIESIIRRVAVCRIAMCEAGRPYVVPVSSGYRDWGIKYRSVIGFGQASFVDDDEEKRRALDVIVAHYGGQPQDNPSGTLEKTMVARIDIQSATAKMSDH
jgi:nitroimidazol reductase NimA-like FMN-containing flavoprotein (pyridoxamine 5'-phosphate oxidase superfamily)